MSKTFYKTMPFDIETAKKVASGEVKGKIETRKGNKVCILKWNAKNLYPIIAILTDKENDVERAANYTVNGRYSAIQPTDDDLVLKLPNYRKDYSNFKPHLWQACIVRDYNSQTWEVKVCTEYKGEQPLFLHVYLNGNGGRYASTNYDQRLPISKVTERLIGTTKTYEQLINELDNGKDTNR